MSNVEEKLARSLTGESTAIIPYLPYLLQDLWELGALPSEINNLISSHIPITKDTRILDLACGKGAVSINLAKSFGCRVKGIDIIPEFIDYAVKKAYEHGVENLCQFQVEDINRSIQTEKGYDIVVYAAVGDVLGDIHETIVKLKDTVVPGRYILIDDAYSNEGNHEMYASRQQWLTAFRDTGVKLVAERTMNENTMEAVNQYNQNCIIKRAQELQAAHPDQAGLFAAYIQSQLAEINDLQGDITGVVWLLQVI
jgi:cyclopropane fatty-acyl-phospholipid synthase-like methyltransferase